MWLLRILDDVLDIVILKIDKNAEISNKKSNLSELKINQKI